jgi:hypothetical protein
VDSAAEFALACADLQNTGWARILFFELTHNPSGVAEEKVDPAQISAAFHCARVGRIQRIQNFGNDNTI